MPRLGMVKTLALALLSTQAAASPLHFFQAEFGFRPKDFCVIRDGSGYHIFYIRVRAIDNCDCDIGHATSTDLRTWTHQSPALLPTGHAGGKFDGDKVWAPCVVQTTSGSPYGGSYWMFYTGDFAPGNNRYDDQAIGLAKSSSLSGTWTRAGTGVNHDEPIVTCNSAFFHCDDVTSEPALRDPFVFPDPDPAFPGRWLMYFVARVAGTPAQMVVGVARTDPDDTDFTRWTVIGEVPGTRAEKVESPHVVHHGLYWYLFFTTKGSAGECFGTDRIDFRVKSNWGDAWGPAQPLRSELSGANYVCGWIASELFDDSGTNYLGAQVGATGIELSEVVWDTPPGFSFATEGRVSSMASNSTSPHEFDPLTITLSCPTDWQGREAQVEYVQLTATGAITFSPPGWDDRVSFSSTTAVLQGPAPACPNGPTNFFVRLKDQTSQTAVIHVSPYGGDHDPYLFPEKTDPRKQISLEVPAIVRAEATFTLQVLGGHYAIDIVDIRGRVVKTIRGTADGGRVSVEWDLRDNSGRRVPSGVLYARLQTGSGQAASKQFTVLR